MTRTSMTHFTVDDSNSFLGSKEFLPVVLEFKYLGIILGKFSDFIIKLCCVHSLELPH